MKKIFAIVLAVLMLASVMCFTSCNEKEEVLTIYTEAGFAPYEFVYEGEIVGVDIKIMEAVAAKLGKKLVVEDVNFDSILGAVKGGKADAGAAGITITPERAEEVDFSVPYSSTEQYVIVKADNNEIVNLETMAGKKVGVQQGTTSDFLVAGLISDNTLAGTAKSSEIWAQSLEVLIAPTLYLIVTANGVGLLPEVEMELLIGHCWQ